MTVAAVLVDGRRLDRQIEQAGLGVGGHVRPHAGVAAPRPRPVLPGLVVLLARAGHRVEAPELLAGADVVGAHETLDVRAVEIAEALEHRRLHDDHVVDDERNGVETNLALLEIDLHLLAVLVDHHALLEVDDALLAEGLDRVAGLGVERHEAVAGGDVVDAVVGLAVGPVGDAAAGQLTGRPARRAFALVHAVHPLLFAGLAVERDDRAAGAGDRVDRAADHDRRRAKLGLGARTEVVGLEAPGHFHLAEIARVNLIERRVLAAAQVGGIHRPVAVLRARHAARLSGHAWADPRENRDEQRHRGHNTKCDALHSIHS